MQDQMFGDEVRFRLIVEVIADECVSVVACPPWGTTLEWFGTTEDLVSVLRKMGVSDLEVERALTCTNALHTVEIAVEAEPKTLHHLGFSMAA